MKPLGFVHAGDSVKAFIFTNLESMGYVTPAKVYETCIPCFLDSVDNAHYR